MINLKNHNKIRISDYSEYKEGLSNNGGCYSFWETYTRTENGFEISHGTTADFEFCKICGSFGGCSCTDDDYETISEEELINRIEKAKIKEDCFVEYLD